MTTTNPNSKAGVALDRADARVRHDASLGGAIREFGDRIRSGDLGSLPVVVGLAVIWTVFQTLNPVFLSSNNLVNLLFDSSTTGVIAHHSGTERRVSRYGGRRRRGSRSGVRGRSGCWPRR